MSDADPRFAEFIAKCTEVLEIPTPELAGNSTMFQVGDRWIELRYTPEDDRVTLAALIYVAPPEASLRADLIASFNVQYLFNGGFNLITDGDQGTLYVCRPHRLASLGARHIRDDLASFARTAAMAGTWYIRTDEERPVAPPRGSTTSGDTAGYIKL
jgi:hypothetical protein